MINDQSSERVLDKIAQCGQSIWLDHLSREFILSGELKHWIDVEGIRGITSNPVIFEAAICNSDRYDDEIQAAKSDGGTVDSVYEQLVVGDIQQACEAFLPLFHGTNQQDGFVSVEVSPKLAHDKEGSLEEARRLHQKISKPNVMIKIPGTPEGLEAVEVLISEGINVNVTLLFSCQQYIDTLWAYIRGLEKRTKDGLPVHGIASVASFFLSRIDAKVDPKLQQAASSRQNQQAEIESLAGKLAISNAKRAYAAFESILKDQRWVTLESAGAQRQRLLWASTGTKNSAYSDVMYVEPLIGPDTVNTLPMNTLKATIDHAEILPTVTNGMDEAEKIFKKVESYGIDVVSVMDELLIEGIEKFDSAFESLRSTLNDQLSRR